MYWIEFVKNIVFRGIILSPSTWTKCNIYCLHTTLYYALLINFYNIRKIIPVTLWTENACIWTDSEVFLRILNCSLFFIHFSTARTIIYNALYFLFYIKGYVMIIMKQFVKIGSNYIKQSAAYRLRYQILIFEGHSGNFSGRGIFSWIIYNRSTKI